MADENTNTTKKSQSAPSRVQESTDAPRQMNASEDASALGTNASGKPVSSKPKKN